MTLFKINWPTNIRTTKQCHECFLIYIYKVRCDSHRLESFSQFGILFQSRRERKTRTLHAISTLPSRQSFANNDIKSNESVLCWYWHSKNRVGGCRTSFLCLPKRGLTAGPRIARSFGSSWSHSPHAITNKQRDLVSRNESVQDDIHHRGNAVTSLHFTISSWLANLLWQLRGRK